MTKKKGATYKSLLKKIEAKMVSKKKKKKKYDWDKYGRNIA